MPPHDSSDVARRLVARLKIRHLALLLQIHKHGSLTKAAEHMSTSQPAVTHALAELEELFGTPLFDRSVRGMTATVQGEAVLARARAMLHDLDLLTLDIEAVSAGRVAHLHIGTIPFISGQLLSAAIQSTLPAKQQLTVTLHEGTSDQLLQMLADHALDFVIGRASPTLDMSGIQHDVLYHQSPRLITSRRTAGRLGRRPLEWAHLLEMDWVLGPRHTPIRNQIADIFFRAGLVPPLPVVESHSSKLIGEIIASNDAAASIVPTDVAEELVRIAGVAIVPYTFDWTLPPVALFTRKESSPRAIDTLFSNALQKLCLDAGSKRHDSAYPY